MVDLWASASQLGLEAALHRNRCLLIISEMQYIQSIHSILRLE